MYGTTINKLHKLEIMIDASKVYSNNIEFSILNLVVLKELPENYTCLSNT